jgi:hypothetical protein
VVDVGDDAKISNPVPLHAAPWLGNGPERARKFAGFPLRPISLPRRVLFLKMGALEHTSGTVSPD